MIVIVSHHLPYFKLSKQPKVVIAIYYLYYHFLKSWIQIIFRIHVFTFSNVCPVEVIQKYTPTSPFFSSVFIYIFQFLLG